MDLNHRPPGPELENQKFISAASGVAYGIAGHLFPLMNWTEVGRKFDGNCGVNGVLHSETHDHDSARGDCRADVAAMVVAVSSLGAGKARRILEHNGRKTRNH